MNRSSATGRRSRPLVLVQLAVFSFGLFSFSQAQASTCDVVLPGLVAHYRFDNNAADATFHANHGTAYGGVGYVAGICGQAVRLDGVDDFVAMDSGVILTLSIFTISVWVSVASYPTGPTDSAYMVVHDRDNGELMPNSHFEFRVGEQSLYSG